MAVFAVLMGGLAGFGSFLVTLLVYDWSILGAFGIYSFVGILSTLALVTISVVTQTLQTPTLQEHSHPIRP